MNKCKKFDRISFKTNDGILHGIIIKGGIGKVQIQCDNGKTYSGHAFHCEPSTDPLPKDKPSVMDKWGVIKHKEFKHGHGDSRTFHAEITLNGKSVMTVDNDGWGGCNEYHETTKIHNIYNQFLNDIYTWKNEFNAPDYFDEDIWVDWYLLDKPYGTTMEKFISNMGVSYNNCEAFAK